MKSSIKELLKSVLRKKFATYEPETNYMPFHERLIGSDKMALFSFIQGLNTTFGTSIFEPVAVLLAKAKFEITQKQVVVGEFVSKNALYLISEIMANLESGLSEADKFAEVEMILKVAKSGELVRVKPVKADLFLQNKNEIWLFDLKTAKPNKSSFVDYKRTLLTWVAMEALQNDGVKTNSLLAIPYNPYFPKPYSRWTLKGMFDLAQEIKIAEDFWDFLGGSGSYEMLLEAFGEVGDEMRDEFEAFFSRFKACR